MFLCISNTFFVLLRYVYSKTCSWFIRWIITLLKVVSLTLPSSNCRVVSIQAWGRRQGCWLPQHHTKTAIRMQEKPYSQRKHRQEHRERPAAGSRRSQQALSSREARSGGLLKPRGHVHRPRPLRHILGTEWQREGRCPQQLLRLSGSCFHWPWLHRAEEGAGYRTIGAKNRPEGDLPEDSRPLSEPRGRTQPVQDAALCQPIEQQGVADIMQQCCGELSEHCIWLTSSSGDGQGSSGSCN